jgi:DNA adenine methylase
MIVMGLDSKTANHMIRIGSDSHRNQRHLLNQPLLNAVPRASTRSAPDHRPVLLPFLKWAGGKRWLTSQYPGIFPNQFDRYVEPFLGSGAVYFHLRPRKALVSDSNANLITTYIQIKSSWQKVERALKRHHRNHCEGYYYEERARKHRAAHEIAAQFIYLNRTCWNGLYRVNMRGVFNVPIGTKTAVTLDSDNFGGIARQLRATVFQARDFERTIAEARKGDFLFVDPPYITSHNFNGFAKYNDKIFSWSDQERLAETIRSAARRGAKILLMNADHQSLRDLYFKVGTHHSLTRHSVLAADSNNRGQTTELAVTINFDPDL